MKKMADKMEAAEMEATQGTYEAEVALREQQLRVKQTQVGRAPQAEGSFGIVSRGALLCPRGEIFCGGELRKGEFSDRPIPIPIGRLIRSREI